MKRHSPASTVLHPAAVTALALVLMGSAAFASEERQQFYSTQEGPHAEKDGLTIHLVSFDQKASHLSASIQVSNNSNVVVELPAKDLSTTWLDVVSDGKTYAAKVSYTDSDDMEGQHWPDARPLRRIVDLQPYQVKTYFVNCDYDSKLTDADLPPALVAHVLVGPGKKPVDVRLDFPPAPSKASP